MTDWLPILMMALLFAGVMLGYPVALVLGGSAVITLLIGDMPLAILTLLVSRIYANALSNWLLVAIPMFILMGVIIEKTGLAGAAIKAATQLTSGIPASMAVTVLVVGAMLAASTGVVGASVTVLSLLAYPRMVSAGYAPSIASGLILSTGTLSILMPPSIMLIVLSELASVPVGSLFAAAIPPTFLLLGSFAAFMFLVAWLRPDLVPWRDAAGAGGHDPVWLNLLRLVPFFGLIPLVLGAILIGLATPTEASGIGVACALVIGLVARRLSWRVVSESLHDTLRTTGSIMMIVIAATCFSGIFIRVGGDDLVTDALLGLGFGGWGILVTILAVVFLLGTILDWLEISLILMPIVVPIITGLDLGLDLSPQATLVWFAILMAVCMQTSFLSPPVGASLFYMRAAVPDRLLTTKQMYIGTIPFTLLQLGVLALLLLVPTLIVSG